MFVTNEFAMNMFVIWSVHASPPEHDDDA